MFKIMFVKLNGKYCFIIDEDYNYSSIELHKKYDLLLKCYICSTYFVINPPCGPALYLLCNKTLCLCFFIRMKNFEKGGDYDKTWKVSEDGKVNTDGPRMVVDERNGAGPQGGFITK
jgi:hypothetical protein